jgi:hypothetical protein
LPKFGIFLEESMKTQSLKAIELFITNLSITEQLALIEFISKHLQERLNPTVKMSDLEYTKIQFESLARDPEINTGID